MIQALRGLRQQAESLGVAEAATLPEQTLLRAMVRAQEWSVWHSWKVSEQPSTPQPKTHWGECSEILDKQQVH